MQLQNRGYTSKCTSSLLKEKKLKQKLLTDFDLHQKVNKMLIKKSKTKTTKCDNSVRCIQLFWRIKNYSNVYNQMSALSVADQNLEAFSQRG